MMKIGFLGLGIMGAGMARNLAAAGYDVRGWNRTPRDLPPGCGDVRVARTLAEAVAGREVVFASLTGPHAQHEVFSEDALRSFTSGTLVLDATTGDPETAAALHERCAAHGVEYCDTPVFGSKPESWNGKLDVLFGGSDATFARAEPVLQTIAKSVHHLGPTGTATAMKLVGNAIVAAEFLALAEGMALAKRAGIAGDRLTGVLDVVDFGSALLQSSAKSALAGDFSVAFSLHNMLKDARLVQDLARTSGVPVFGSAAAVQMLQTAVNLGFGDENVSAIVKAVDDLSSR